MISKLLISQTKKQEVWRLKNLSVHDNNNDIYFTVLTQHSFEKCVIKNDIENKRKTFCAVFLFFINNLSFHRINCFFNFPQTVHFCYLYGLNLRHLGLFMIWIIKDEKFLAKKITNKFKINNVISEW